MNMKLILAAGVAAIAIASPAQADEGRARAKVQPYLQVDQSVFHDFKGNGGTYATTGVGAGVTVDVSTAMTDIGADVLVRHNFGWGRNAGDTTTLNGILRGRRVLVPNLLQIEGGALASRINTSFPGAQAVPSFGTGHSESQLYSAYVQPSLETNVGDLNVGAAYRFGFSKVDTNVSGGAANQVPLNYFDRSTNHMAQAHVGMGTHNSPLPFGWTVSGGWERDDQNRLDSRFDSKVVRGEVIVPVAPTVAVVGGVGYEKIQSSQRDVVRDVNGTPVLDANGGFQTDPASARQLTYDSSGVIWDAGVMWRPSPRTSATAQIGRRYGSMTYTGTLGWHPDDRTALSVAVFDGVQTFGRQMASTLAAMPTAFNTSRDPFSGSLGGCVFGTGASSAAGTCLNDVLQGISVGTFRSRGVNVAYTHSTGPWSYGVGGGYTARRYYAPNGLMVAANNYLARLYYLNGYAAYQIDDQSGLSGALAMNWFDQQAISPTVTNVTVTGSYYRNFSRRLMGMASLGLSSTKVEGLQSTLTGAAQVGARYAF